MSLRPQEKPNLALPFLALPIFALILTAAILFAGGFDATGEKMTALFSAILIFLLCLTPMLRRRLAERTSIFFLLVSSYVIYAGISTLYAYAPKPAISEFSRLLLAYAVFLTTFTFLRDKRLPQVASVFAGTSALLSFLSLDAASWGILATPLFSFVSRFITGYTIESYGLAFARINGLFGNSNTMAFVCAIGLFMSAFLLMRASAGRRRVLPCAAIFLNAYAFILCTSLGAFFSLGLSILLVLVLTKDIATRFSLLAIILETLIVAAVAAALSQAHLGNNSGTGYIIWLCALGGSGILYGLDFFLRAQLVGLLTPKSKYWRIAFGGLLVILATAVILAFSLKSPITITRENYCTRIFYPGSGSCQVSVQTDGVAGISLSYADKNEILMGTSQPLFSGENTGEIVVDVPEDAAAVYLQVYPTSEQPVTISNISYSGSEKSGQLPTGYKLIAQNIVTRLQGLRTNASALQRFEIMSDGLRIWKTTPIFGRGLGGYANGQASVQRYHFETRYAHNHYIQSMSDLGLVGLLLYVGILVLGFAAILSMRKRHPAALEFPMLLGIMLMVSIHGTIELFMSVTEGLVFAFAGFAMVAQYAPPLLPETARRRREPLVIGAGIGAFGLLFTVLLSCNLWAQKATASGMVTMELLDKCQAMDVFEGNDYRLAYINLAPRAGSEAYLKRAQEFVQEMEDEHSNVIPGIISEYYYANNQPEKALDAAKRQVTLYRADPDIWNGRFHSFSGVIDPRVDPNNAMRLLQADQYIPGFLEIYDLLKQTNQAQLDSLLPDYQSCKLIGQLLACEDAGYDDPVALSNIFQSMVFDSRYFVDANADAMPDNLYLNSGEYTIHPNGAIEMRAGTSISLLFDVGSSTGFTVEATGSTPEDFVCTFPTSATELIDGVWTSTCNPATISEGNYAYVVLTATQDTTVDSLVVRAIN